ncbi:MAG: DNA methyltransferase [Candidatus Hodarchaeales archaeon]
MDVSINEEKEANHAKIINVGHERSCDCSEKHINCLTAKEWIKAQVGVWEFYYEKRDIRNKKLHPATFPLSLAKRVIELFTHKGELIVDPFVGSGTTLLAAKDLERNAVGFDLKDDFIELSKSRLTQAKLNEFFDADKHHKPPEQLAFREDARKCYRYLKDDTIKLVFTSPPYANLLNRKRKNKSRRGNLRKNEQFLDVEQYSQDSRDLGILEHDQYESEIEKIYRNLLPKVVPLGHVVVNIGDMWWENKRIPLHISIIRAIEKAGFEFRNTIIWDRNNIVNRIGIFGWPSNYITMGTTFEYILHFRKPKEL